MFISQNKILTRKQAPKDKNKIILDQFNFSTGKQFSFQLDFNKNLFEPKQKYLISSRKETKETEQPEIYFYLPRNKIIILQKKFSNKRKQFQPDHTLKTKNRIKLINY